MSGPNYTIIPNDWQVLEEIINDLCSRIIDEDASLSDYILADGSRSFTGRITSAYATGGLSPFIIASTTLNTNLNADLLDGLHASDFIGAGEETDPVFSAWDKSTGISITESQISDLQAYLTAETDPIVGAITGIVKANGAGVISAAEVGTDYDNYWSRASTTVSPRTVGDNISTTGKGTFGTIDIGTATKEWDEGDYALMICGLTDYGNISLVYIPTSDNWPPSSSGGAKMIIGWNNVVGNQFDLGDYVAIGSIRSTNSLIFTTKNLAGNDFLTRLDISGGITVATADWKTTHLKTSGNINLVSDDNKLFVGANGNTSLGYTKLRSDNYSAAHGFTIRVGTTGFYVDVGENSKLLIDGTSASFADNLLLYGANNRIMADNGKWLFGGGSDASIYYDATNLIINPKEAGTGYLSILGDIFVGTNKYLFNGTDTYFSEVSDDVKLTTPANKTLVLSQPVYNDANVGGMALRQGVTSPPVTQWVDNLGANTGIYGLGFAELDEANGSIEIPHDYKEGTNIVFHIHWGANAAPTDTDYVKWQLTYFIDSETVEGTTPPATPIVIETVYDTQYEHKRSDFPTITGTNFKIGDQINFNIKRIAAAGAAFVGVAIVETIGFHYETDTLGSRTITAK